MQQCEMQQCENANVQNAKNISEFLRILDVVIFALSHFALSHFRPSCSFTTTTTTTLVRVVRTFL